jgi:hypothetical protein
MSRILWLANADARGHLMRCQLVTRRLRRQGFEVDVITTSREGQAFLGAFGVEASLLSEHYRVEFDTRQNMQRLRTEWRVFRYLTSPGRFWRDLPWLEERARGASLIVNDSFHPALLLAHRFRRGTLPPVVHVYGHELRRAVEDNYARRWPTVLERIYRRVIVGSTEHAFGRIEHSLNAPAAGREIAPCTYQLPPALAAPGRSREAVRSSLGLSADQKLVVAYLNPHFADPAVAEAIEGAIHQVGGRLHAVGEGYARRAGWLPWDTELADAIAAADVFVSAPGVAALGQSVAFGVPLLTLLTDQPEQRGNLRALSDSGHPHRVVELAGEGFPERVAEAMSSLVGSTRPSAKAAPSGLDTWARVLETLSGRAAA